MRFGVALLLLAGFNACTNRIHPPTSASKPTEMKNSTSGPYHSMQYKTGNPSFRGETTLKLGADGTAAAMFVQGSNTQRYHGKLDAKENAAIWASITALNPCTLKKSRAGQPGENTLSFSMETESGPCHGEAWMNDQYENALLLAATKEISAVLGKISGGLLTH